MSVLYRAVETVLGLNAGLDPKRMTEEVMRVVRADAGHGMSEGRPLTLGHGVKCRCGEWFNRPDYATALAALEAHHSAATFAAID